MEMYQFDLMEVRKQTRRRKRNIPPVSETNYPLTSSIKFHAADVQLRLINW